jgi:hypothetical protein
MNICLRPNSFRLIIKNVAGTIKHAFSPLNYIQSTFPSPLDPNLMPSINLPTNDLIPTPTGSFAGGAALLGGDSRIRLDTQDLGENECRLLVNSVVSTTGVAINAVCILDRDTINGVLLNRPQITLNRADNNAAIAINTTNISTGQSVTIDAIGWIK